MNEEYNIKSKTECWQCGTWFSNKHTKCTHCKVANEDYVERGGKFNEDQIVNKKNMNTVSVFPNNGNLYGN
jgi:hypothetical protein